jgi:hypothetical protein
MKLPVLVLIMLVPVLLFACALAMIVVPLPHPFPPALSGDRNLVAAIATGLLGFGYVVGVGVYGAARFLAAGRVLDPVLAQAGLSTESYMLFGRRYHGELEGRAVAVTFMPAQVIRPAQLNVTVRADLGTRIALGRERPLLDCRDCARVDVVGTAWEGLHVYARDAPRAQRLLDDATACDLVSRILADRDGRGLREIYVQPDRVWLHARPYALTAAQFESWFRDMLVLAEVSETVLGRPLAKFIEVQ